METEKYQFTINTADGDFVVSTRQDVRTLWWDVEWNGNHAASFKSQHEAIAWIFQTEEEDNGETLGPCGCVDYHVADCPIVTSHTSSEDYYDGS